MLNFLKDTSGSKALYILRTAALTLTGAFAAIFLYGLLVYALVGFDDPSVMQADSGPDFPTDQVFVLIFLVVIFSPIVETLIMWPIIAGLKRLTSSYWSIALISAFIWAVFHSTMWLIWGFIIFWPFLLMSMAFLNWQKVSNAHAYWMTCAIHMTHNSVAAALMIAGS